MRKVILVFSCVRLEGTPAFLGECSSSETTPRARPATLTRLPEEAKMVPAAAAMPPRPSVRSVQRAPSGVKSRQRGSRRPRPTPSQARAAKSLSAESAQSER